MERRLLNLTEKLEKLKKDWLDLLANHSLVDNPDFLARTAGDIQTVDEAALASKKEKELHDEIELIDFVLATPWGAPFVGHATLLEAARKDDKKDLKELMQSFGE